MTTDELINALERMKSETGSLADSLCCLGCGRAKVTHWMPIPSYSEEG